MPIFNLVQHIRTVLGKCGLASIVALIAALSISAPPAQACSCSFPIDWGFIGSAKGRLPANAAGVAWYMPEPLSNEVLVNRFTAEILENGNFRQLQVNVKPVENFTGVYIIAPMDEGLIASATYRFTVDKIGQYASASKQVLVTIDHENLLAESTLNLEIDEATNELIRVAAAVSCSIGLDVAQVSFEAMMPPSQRQWREQLLYRTLVDGGESWYGTSSLRGVGIPGRS